MPTPSDSPATKSWDAKPKEAPRSVFGNFQPKMDPPQSSEPRQTVRVAQATLTLQEQIDLAIARAFIYRLLAKAFEDPEAETWRWLSNPQTATALRLAAKTVGRSALQTAVQLYVSAFQPGAFEKFEAHYIAAFGHTARGECPLNEVEYGDIKADPLFQPHRLADLGAFYSAFGLEIADQAAERHDHIAIEFEFMSVLAAKSAYAIEHQLEEDNLAVCRDAQRTFLREHLGRWIPGFTRRLERLTENGPLAALAVLTREFLMSECDEFGVMPGSDDLVLRSVDDATEQICNACGINNLPPGASTLA